MSGDVKKVGQQLESNVSRNLQGTAADLSRIAAGDLNNAGRSILRAGLTSRTGGLINPDQARNITGETGGERAVREAGEQEVAQEQADIQAREDERKQQIIRRISEEIEGRRLSPGTSLLTTGALAQQSAGNTILTARR